MERSAKVVVAAISRPRHQPLEGVSGKAHRLQVGSHYPETDPGLPSQSPCALVRAVVITMAGSKPGSGGPNLLCMCRIPVDRCAAGCHRADQCPPGCSSRSRTGPNWPLYLPSIPA